MPTKRYIDFIKKETEGALVLLYTMQGFRECLADTQLVSLINKNPIFWRAHNASVQSNLFIILGRLSDDSSETKSFKLFNDHCFTHLCEFYRSAFEERHKHDSAKMNLFESRKGLENKEQMSHIFSLTSGKVKYINQTCREIRSKVYAHAILSEEHEHFHLFKKVNLIEIENILLAMWSVSNLLWEAYVNIRVYEPEIIPYYDKENVFSSIKNVISGI